MDTSTFEAETQPKYVNQVIQESNRIKDIEEKALESLTVSESKLSQLNLSLIQKEVEVKELTVKLSSLIQTLESHNFYNGETAKEISDLRKKANESTRLLHEIRNTLNECKNEKDRFDQINLSNKKDIDDLYLRRENEIRRLKNDLKKLMDRLDSLNFDRKKEELQQQEENSKLKLSSLILKLQELQNELSAAGNVEEIHKSKISEYDEKISNLVNEVKNIESVQLAIKEEISDIKEQLQVIEKDSSKPDLEQIVQSLKMQKEESENQISETMEENKLERNYIEEAIKNINESYKILGKICMDVEKFLITSLNPSYNEIQKKVEIIDTNYQARILEIDATMGVIEELENKIKAKGDEIKCMNSDISTIKQSVDQIKLTNEQCKNKEELTTKIMDSLNNEALSLREDIAVLKGKIEFVKQQADKEKIQFENEQLTIDAASKRMMQELEGELKSIEEDINISKKKYDNEMGNMTDNYTEIIASLELQVRNLEAEKSKLNVKIKEETADLKQLTIQSDTLAKHIKSISQNRRHVPHFNVPQPLPPKREYNDMSDSSMEGTGYSPRKYLSVRKSDDRKKMIKVKKQKIGN